MKGKVPDKIFLQIDEDEYNEYTSTWCENRINESDIEYVMQKQLPADIARMIKDVESNLPACNMSGMEMFLFIKRLIKYIKTGE